MAEEHPYDRYDRELKVFEEAEKNLEVLVARIDEMVAKIHGWKDLGIEDHYHVFGDAIRKSPKDVIIEARDWPTIHQIDEALKQYQKAKINLRGAHQALSNEQRQKIVPCPV